MSHQGNNNSTGSHSSVTGNSITIFDSLPYIDTIHPEYEQYAIALMEQEMQQLSPSSQLHPRVIQSVQQSQASRKRRRLSPEEISHTIEEYRNNIPNSVDTTTDKIDKSKIYIIDESFPSKPSVNDTDNTNTNNNTVEEWNVTIRKARIAYEKERIRSMEFEVDQDTLSELWKRYNHDILQGQLDQYQQLVQNQQYQVTKINYERQEHQTKEYHVTLSKLQYQHHDLLQKIYALQNAIQAAK